MTSSNKMNISDFAHKQWANRPDDERFRTLDDLHADALKDKETSYTVEGKAGDVHCESEGSNLLLTMDENRWQLTNYGFEQVCGRVGCPANYIARIPTDLAQQCIEHGLRERPNEAQREIYVTPDRVDPKVKKFRSMLSGRYERIHDADVTERLLELGSNGWKVPPSLGDKPAGLYRGERDLFAFLIDGGSFLDEPGKGGADGGLHRGVFVSNSEVGYRKLNVTSFFHRGVCGNHLVWGLESSISIDLIHVGDIREEWTVKVSGAVEEFAKASAKKDLTLIRRAQKLRLGENKDEVLDNLFGIGSRIKRRSVFTEKRNAAAWEAAEENADVDGDPRTAWGMLNGFTRISQDEPYAEKRAKIDNAAGRMLQYVLN